MDLAGGKVGRDGEKEKIARRCLLCVARCRPGGWRRHVNRKTLLLDGWLCWPIRRIRLIHHARQLKSLDRAKEKQS